MKVLLIGRWRTEGPNGPDAVVQNLTREFLALGHEVTVWSPNSRIREVSGPRVGNGATIIDMPRFTRLPLLPSVTRAFVRDQSRGFDVALVFSAFTPLNVLAARNLRCPYVAVPLGGYARASMQARRWLRKRIFLALCERAFLERAQFVNVWSRNEQEDVALIARPRRFVITPPGFVAPSGMPARAPRSAAEGRNLVFLGRFAIAHKGLDRLVRAFERAAGPCDRLTLAGKDWRGGLSALQRLVEASPVRDRITIEGPAFGAAKYELFQRADVFVHLSRWEGLPLSVVEALAFGVPVLVSRETNAGEYVTAYDAGWLVNDVSFESAVRTCLQTSAGDLNQKGENARRLVAQEFRWDSAVRTLVHAFREVHA